MKDAVAAFQQEWKKTFFKELNSKSAEAYLEHLKKIGKKGRKTRKLRGGMAPIGSPTMLLSPAMAAKAGTADFSNPLLLK
jgi:hypothetical protein